MKKVIIIGATSGIGRALATHYAQNNWLVGITGRRKALLDELQQAYPANIVRECFDVTGTDNIAHLQFLLQQLGGLDLLIYNSGIGDPADELDMTIDLNTTKTNVLGFVEIVNFGYNYFAKQGHGQIAAISSIASIRGNSFAPAYSASKAFVSNYMEGLYIKTKKQQRPIIITDIQPGFVQTAMAKGDGQFWVSPLEKACQQIVQAIARKKRIAYISRRWRLIAGLMKILPISIYKKIA
jgi:short-subunit dehydrogenase